MPKISKTLVLKIPASVIYESLKSIDHEVRPLVEDAMMIELPAILEDAPNERLVQETKGMGSSVRVTYDLKPINNSTEVTVTVEHGRLTGELVGKLTLRGIITCLKAREQGYKAGIAGKGGKHE